MVTLDQIQSIIVIIASSLTVIGMPFVVYSVYNRNRSDDIKSQENLDKVIAVTTKEVEGKSTLTAQQLQWEKELNEKKFKEMGERIDRALTLAENHTHTVDVKVDALITAHNQTNIEIAKLETTIKLMMQLPSQTTNIIKN